MTGNNGNRSLMMTLSKQDLMLNQHSDEHRVTTSNSLNTVNFTMQKY